MRILLVKPGNVGWGWSSNRSPATSDHEWCICFHQYTAYSMRERSSCVCVAGRSHEAFFFFAYMIDGYFGRIVGCLPTRGEKPMPWDGSRWNLASTCRGYIAKDVLEAFRN